MLTYLVPKYLFGEKIWYQCGCEGEGSPLGGPYLPDDVHMPPLYGEAHVRLWRGGTEGGTL